MSKIIVLDACCGSRMFWFNKRHPSVLYADNRRGEEIACDGRTIGIYPDMNIDFTEMPFPNDFFYHVVFDPPHLLRAGAHSWLAQKYGTLPDDWKATIRKGFSECWRVLKPGGTLVFKWNEDQVPLKEVLQLAPVSPMYGNRRSKTHWIVFVKTEGISHD